MKFYGRRYVCLLIVFLMGINLFCIPDRGYAEAEAVESKIKLELEENSLTHRPYIGTVCGSKEGLQIKLNFPGIKEGSLKVKPPKLGIIQGNSLGWNDKIKLENNSGIINYIPPDYLAEWQLKDQDPQTSKWYTLDIVALTYLDANDNEQEITADIRLYRPPIILTSGFTGDDKIWANCSLYLNEQKFDTQICSCNALDESMRAQTQTLQQSIDIKKEEYLQQDIKIQQVDMVAHGIGGLIGRFYVENNQDSNIDIRKLIMVGTPNHGINITDLPASSLQAQLLSGHESSIKQINKNSDFLRALNEGETYGTHLNDNVQYANIYSYSPYPGYYSGDMLITAASIYLNGVPGYAVSGDVHSTAFPGTPIADDPRVWEAITAWLNQEIYRPDLDRLSIGVCKTEGEVTIRKYTEEITDIKVQDTSTRLTAGEDLCTEDGKCVLRFMINGNSWAYVYLDRNTEAAFDYISPELIEIRVKRGNVRFNTLKEGGHFSVVLVEDANIQRIRLTDRDTDFIVSLNDNIEVYTFTGQVFAGVMNTSNDMEIRTLRSAEGILLDTNNNVHNLVTVSDLWYEDDFYKFTFWDKVKEYLIQLKEKAQILVKRIL